MDSLCHLCRHIGTDTSNWYLLRTDISTLMPGYGGPAQPIAETLFYPHHRNVWALKAAADLGCPLCLMLFDNLPDHDKLLQQHSPGHDAEVDSVAPELQGRVFETPENSANPFAFRDPDEYLQQLCGKGRVILKRGTVKGDLPLDMNVAVVGGKQVDLRLCLTTHYRELLATRMDGYGCNGCLLTALQMILWLSTHVG